MPWIDGKFERYNGEFTGDAVWQNDRDAGYEIDAARHDAHDQDLASGIAACLPRDGSGVMAGPLDLGGYPLSNLAQAQLDDELVLLGQTITNVSFENDSIVFVRPLMPNFVVDLTAQAANNKGSRIISLDTVADMLSASYLMEGNRVRTAGRNTAADGGGSEYEIGSGFGVADNFGGVFDLANGLQARNLHPEGHVNGRAFGMVGDGVTNDTASAEAAHDTAISLGQRCVFVPPGNYVVDNDARIDDVVWLGSGTFSSSGADPSAPNSIRTAIREQFNGGPLAARETLNPRQHFRVSAQTLAPKVVIMGDSLATPFADSIAPSETMWDEIKRQITRANPGRDFTFVNRAIGGTTWTSGNQNLFGLVPGNIDWYTEDQPWLDYAEAEAPDLLILSWGMNDASAFVTAQLRSLLQKISLWSKVPDILFVTNLVPSRMSDNDNVSGTLGQEGRDMVAGYVRTYADSRGYGYLDLNRQCNLVRDGRDVTASYFEKVLDAQPVNLPYVGAGLECADWGGVLELTSIPATTFGALDVSGSDRLRIYYGLEGANSQTFVEVGEVGGNLGVMLWDVPGDSEGYSTVLSDVPVPAPGSDVSIEFSIKNNHLVVRVNDSVVFEGGVRRMGGVNPPTITRSTGAASSGTLTVYRGHYLDTFAPIMTDMQIWGAAAGQGGNDSNHPTSLGAAALYGTLLGQVDWQLPILTEGSGVSGVGAIRAGVGKPDPKALLHVGDGADADTPAADANDFVVEHPVAPGISLLSNSDGTARIKAGDSDNPSAFVLSYNHTSDVMGVSIQGESILSVSQGRVTLLGEARFQAEDNSGTVNNQARSITWDLTSDTNLRIRVRGNDGTVRTSNLVLS